MMKGWPVWLESSAPTARAAVSVNEPAANGTMMRTVLLGQAWLCTGVAPMPRPMPMAHASADHFWIMSGVSVFFG